MNLLIKVIALERYQLVCTFNNGVEKVADMAPFLIAEVFIPLQNVAIFSQVQNHGDYISWLNEEIDLSADTLWHIGVEIVGKLPSLQLV